MENEKIKSVEEIRAIIMRYEDLRKDGDNTWCAF